jgi:transglutaminase-like putative cysteine protease
MRYTVQHSTRFTYTDPVPICHNRVHLAPRQTARQNCRLHRLSVDPEPSVFSRRIDYFGNEVDFFSVQESHEGLTVTADSVVEVLPPPPIPSDLPAWEEVAAKIPTDNSPEGLIVHHCALPSPRVVPTDDLRSYARPSFTAARPIVEAVSDLMLRIYTEFAFDPRATTVHTPPQELLSLRRGVCQDFAHLAIGCLRSLGLSARYVSGYVCTTPPPNSPRLLGADASHAWLSVHCGPAGWIDFDPTNNVIVGDAHVTIGWGRDYTDVRPIQGVFVGGGDHSMTVAVDVVPTAP